MTGAMSAVRTIEITSATRSTKANGLGIKQGEIIGLLDGELLAAGDDSEKVVIELLEKIDMTGTGILTVYYGKDGSGEEAERIGEKVSRKYPDLEGGVVNGGQPNYQYIVSVE